MKKIYRAFYFLICAALCFFSSRKAYGAYPEKEKNKTDPVFIQSYEQELTGRVYLSQKYTSISLGGSSQYPGFRYRPNTTLNLGLGATYRSFSLNLAYGFPGLNGDGSQRGKTKYLDLQSHFYSRKWVLDLLGQFYHGYYLAPRNYVPGFPAYYINPDLKVRLTGVSAYYIFNPGRFSYRAALTQNEWQTRSAGTFLAGFDFYYGILKDEQAIIPEEISAAFPQGDVQRMRFINFGPGVGYAYTFVYKKNWFVTGSLTANLTVDLSKERSATEDRNNLSVSPNFLYRLGAGYNSATWACIFSLVNSTVSALGDASNKAYIFRTGNYRLTLAKRFSRKKKVDKLLDPIDKVMGQQAR
jgi:hypothetical protein